MLFCLSIVLYYPPHIYESILRVYYLQPQYSLALIEKKVHPCTGTEALYKPYGP